MFADRLDTMIQTIDLRGTPNTPAALLAAVPRALTGVTSASDIAAELIDDVRTRGGAALLDQAERLDHVRPEHIRVPASHLTEALGQLDPDVRSAVEETIRRVRLGSAAQVPPTVTTTIDAGATITQRWQPVDRVGLYVPAGKAVYPSSVIMNVVPAQIAGVASIALTSPAQSRFGGRVHPTILAVAALLGVDEVYAMGGAGAIGALAYGVPDLGLEPVQIVTGPGNVYVAAAKRLVRGQAGIDSEAGPTDILVIADETADPLLIAADLVSQAEHDELAAAVLVTDSAALADAVAARLTVLAASTTHSERVTAALTGTQSAIVLVDDLQVAANFSNAFGPEHLEIQTRKPEALLESIHNAGAIFLGAHSPVSLGDYSAGSNHVLPTGGQARFSSALGAYTFLRPQQVVTYSREALRAVAANIAAFSNAENLPAHGDAVTARFAQD